jgi:hypothetical protein
MILLAALAATVAVQVLASQTPTFQAGTRLVEVEVVVGNKNGPVAGLTKDDFTILDQGKPQRIDVFRAGQSQSGAPATRYTGTRFRIASAAPVSRWRAPQWCSSISSTQPLILASSGNLWVI